MSMLAVTYFAKKTNQTDTVTSGLYYIEDLSFLKIV